MITYSGSTESNASIKAVQSTREKFDSFIACAKRRDREGMFEIIHSEKDINLTDTNGMTFLHYAVTYDAFTIMAYLMDHGIDLNALDINDKSAYMIALERDEPLSIILLSKKGADTKQRRDKSETTTSVTTETTTTATTTTMNPVSSFFSSVSLLFGFGSLTFSPTTTLSTDSKKSE